MVKCDAEDCEEELNDGEGVAIDINDRATDNLLYETAYCSIDCLYKDLLWINEWQPIDDPSS